MSESDPKKSNFQKRQEKIEIESTLPYVAIDVTNTPEGYKAIEIHYSIKTGRAKVVRVHNSTRLVGLSFEQKKSAIRTLSKLT